MPPWRIDELSDEDGVAPAAALERQSASSSDGYGDEAVKRLSKPQAVEVLSRLLARPCGCTKSCFEALRSPVEHAACVAHGLAWHGLHKLGQGRTLFQHIRDLARDQGLLELGNPGETPNKRRRSYVSFKLHVYLCM